MLQSPIWTPFNHLSKKYQSLSFSLGPLPHSPSPPPLLSESSVVQCPDLSLSLSLSTTHPRLSTTLPPPWSFKYVLIHSRSSYCQNCSSIFAIEYHGDLVCAKAFKDKIISNTKSVKVLSIWNPVFEIDVWIWKIFTK